MDGNGMCKAVMQQRWWLPTGRKQTEFGKLSLRIKLKAPEKPSLNAASGALVIC